MVILELTRKLCKLCGAPTVNPTGFCSRDCSDRFDYRMEELLEDYENKRSGLMPDEYSWYNLDKGCRKRVKEVKSNEGELIETEDRYFNSHGKATYIRVYNHLEHKVTYEEWRDYHFNGELKLIRNTEGVMYGFDLRGLPVEL